MSELTDTTETKLKIVNSNSNKNLLLKGINILSTQVQNDFCLKNSSNNRQIDVVILKLENDALEHIENLILDVFDSILLASSNINDLATPENASALVMSNSSSKTIIYPISNLNEAELRVKQAISKSYSNEICSESLRIVEKCKKILNSSKKNRFLKTFNSDPSHQLSILTSPQNNNDNNNNLSYTFSFPLEKIHSILCDIYQTSKLDIYVTIFLVAILEHITKHILLLSSSYSRNQSKYSISKRDVTTTIEVDAKLNYLMNDVLFDCESIDVIDEELIDDDLRTYQLDIELGRFTIDRPGHDFLINNTNRPSLNFVDSTSLVSVPAISNSNDSTITGSNNEESTSDSSTLCPESIAYENLNFNYYSKVKELVLEQQQHLTDLNILRRIFMYLFQKFATEELIENIFGNINEVYELALKLSDLLEEAISNRQHLKQDHLSDNLNLNLNQPLMIGQYFWELAEGREFDLYSKYASKVTDLENVKKSLVSLLNDQNVYKLLQQTGQGLVEISKYLLPRLLFGPIYHFLYLYETVDYLVQISFDEEDKCFLKDTLDTLLGPKLEINFNFKNSKKRPIESSFRIFQPNQFQYINTQNKTTSIDSSTSNLSSVANKKTPALAYNIFSLTERKWKEIDVLVDSLKLPSHICQTQIYLNNLSQNKNTPINNITSSNIRYAYLYEGSLQICKTNQSFTTTSNNNLKNTITQSNRTKISKRYVYLFDGLLILVKKQQTGLLLNTNLGSNSKMYRFKEWVQLDKCCLRDREDDLCFEIQILNQFQSDIDQTLSSQSQLDLNQDQEFILFMVDSQFEKYEWMSLLCYSMYKLNIDRLLQEMTEEHNKNNPLPIPPKGYIYDKPDSSETILFEQPNKAFDIDQPINPYANSDGLAIKAATLLKLVERLTHHLYIHPKFSPTFLMFFREFSNPKELLSLLSIRYDVPDLDLDQITDMYDFTSGSITKNELAKRYRREYQQPIRLKVINLIKHWIEGYFVEDFADKPNLLEDLKKLIEKIGKTNKRFELVLNKTLQKKIDIHQEQMAYKEQQKLLKQTNEFSSSASSNLSTDQETDYYNLKNIFKKKFSTSLSSNSSLSNTSSSSRSSSTSTTEDADNQEFSSNQLYPQFETHLENLHPYDILTIHPLEFARQATLMEEELFKAIKPNELISIGWNKPTQKYKLSPNVSKLTNLSNKFMYWYAKCIVDTQNLEERIAVVHRLLEIADYFYQMNNFSGLREIYTALDISSTARLEITRKKSGLEQHKMYIKFKQLFDNHDKGYFEKLKKCSPPCIPFIGIHQSKIYRTHEYNKINIDNQKQQIIQEQQKFSTFKIDTNQNESATTHDDSQLNQSSISSNQQETNKQEQNTLINFSKYRSLVEFVNDLLQYQTVSYKFRVNDKIRSFLLEDIENYFETAQHEIETGKIQQTITIQNQNDMVEAWLFKKSREIEPNEKDLNEIHKCDINEYINKFPKIRNYTLKSPQITNRINNKQLLNSKLNDSHRSQSATRLEKKNLSQMSTSSVNKQLQFIPPMLKNSSASISKSNLKPNLKTINISKTSENINNQKEETVLYKRSNSSVQAQYKQQNDLNDTVLNSSVFITTTQSASNFSYIPPFILNTTTSSNSVSSSSPKTPDIQQPCDLIRNNNSQKLSVSSADSSSSAPNSPPPNYDEVFDMTSIENIHHQQLLQQQQLSMQQNKSFENKTYYQKSTSNTKTDIKQAQLTINQSLNDSYTSSSNAISSSSSTSSITASKNQISVFSFPDIIDENLNSSIDQLSPILPPIPPPRPPNPNYETTRLNFSTINRTQPTLPAPSNRPPSPPKEPPPINRLNKPFNLNKSVSMPTQPIPPKEPPPVPTRPKK